jgi:flagellum-specific peptidoglycan hydrolase FlgJ
LWKRFTRKINWWWLLVSALATALALNVILRMAGDPPGSPISGGGIPSTIEIRQQRSAAVERELFAREQFILSMAPAAQATQIKYGTPASVSIAQAIIESTWGKSMLAKKARNYLGIKATSNYKASFSTYESTGGGLKRVIANFTLYEDAFECFDDYGHIISTLPDYRQAMAARSNPEAFANALTGVYATNRLYGRDLVRIMRKYKLQRFDLYSASTDRADRR